MVTLRQRVMHERSSFEGPTRRLLSLGSCRAVAATSVAVLLSSSVARAQPPIDDGPIEAEESDRAPERPSDERSVTPPEPARNAAPPSSAADDHDDVTHEDPGDTPPASLSAHALMPPAEPLASADWLRDSARDRTLRRRATGAALVGIGGVLGLTGAVLGGLGTLRDVGRFQLVQTDGASIDTDVGMTVASVSAGVAGGALGGLGGWMLSSNLLDPADPGDAWIVRRKDGERRTRVRIVGASLVAAGGLLLVGSISSGAAAGAIWNSIPSDSFGPEERNRAANVPRLAGVALALGAGFPVLAGTGIGLLLGEAARPSRLAFSPTWTASGGGVSLRGRF